MKTLIVATKNEGKVAEIKTILQEMDIEVKTMKEAGIDLDIPEEGTSFEENAIMKAEYLKSYTDAWILADDSGLEIDYLQKAPGVYSARYLGENTPYSTKNQKILEKLEGVSIDQRTARFVCVIALARVGKGTQTTIGTLEGYIGEVASGENGFGYDPIFFVKPYHMSVADMDLDLKNQISHRGQALRDMKARLKELLKESK